jgi:hypothetical protein
MMMVKRSNKKLSRLDIEFCAECNEQLDEFDFSPKSTDLKHIKENHNHCKRTGKFKGEFCSKIFISNPDESIWVEED